MDDGNSFPCYGACSDDVVAGLDWIAGYRELPAVMNMSLGGIPNSFAVRNALEGVIGAGVVAVKAAGNDNVDAFQDRANRARGLIVVGASDQNDTRSIFCCGQASDFGSLLTVFAPGSGILSANKNSDTDTLTGSGTSLAAPKTAGIIALILQQEPGASPSRVRDVLIRSSTIGVLAGDLGAGSPNRFVYSKVQAASYPPPPSYPVAPSIYGPDMVRPYSNCLYSVSPGSVNPVTYEWYTDGVLQGAQGSDFRAAASTDSFQLEIHIVDADGNSWWNYKYVTVTSSANECLDT